MRSLAATTTDPSQPWALLSDSRVCPQVCIALYTTRRRSKPLDRQARGQVCLRLIGGRCLYHRSQCLPKTWCEQSLGLRAVVTRPAAVVCSHEGFASPLREYQARPGLCLDRRLGDCFELAAPTKRPRLRRCRRAPTLVSTRLSTSSSRSRPEAHSPNTLSVATPHHDTTLDASSRARFRIRIL